MLPPNLTRHLYETRRLLAADEGRELPPWYRLNPEERAAAEMDMEVFRRAILRAEEEQDLVASYNTATTEPAPAAADSTIAEDCACPGCSVIAAFLELLKQARRLEESMRPRVKTPNSFPFNVGEITTLGPGPRSTPTPEETVRVRKLAQAALDEWVAAGKPLEPATAPAPAEATWTFEFTPRGGIVNLDSLQGEPDSLFDRMRLDFWNNRRQSFPPKV